MGDKLQRQTSHDVLVSIACATALDLATRHRIRITHFALLVLQGDKSLATYRL